MTELLRLDIFPGNQDIENQAMEPLHATTMRIDLGGADPVATPCFSVLIRDVAIQLNTRAAQRSQDRFPIVVTSRDRRQEAAAERALSRQTVCSWC